MKSLIVYFSLEGNTEYIAEKLAKDIEAATLKLVPKKTYHTSGFAKFFWGAEKAFAKLKGILGIDDFYATAIFIDPKDKPSDDNARTLDSFTKSLQE